MLVAINTRLSAGDIGYTLEHSGATTVFCDRELQGQLTEAPAGIRRLNTGADLEALIASGPRRGLKLLRPREIANRAVPDNLLDVALILRLRRELAAAGLDAGPDIIAWHLAHHHRVRVSPATISRTRSRRSGRGALGGGSGNRCGPADLVLSAVQDLPKG